MSEKHTSSSKMGYYEMIIDMLAPLLKKFEKQFPDSLPMNDLLEKTRDFMDKSKAFSDKNQEEMRIRMEKLEKTMREAEMLIYFIEQQQSEL